MLGCLHDKVSEPRLSSEARNFLLPERSRELRPVLSGGRFGGCSRDFMEARLLVQDHPGGRAGAKDPFRALSASDLPFILAD